MEQYEESKDKNLCSKGLWYINSCRECVFQVLCRLENIREKNLFNHQKKDGEKQ